MIRLAQVCATLEPHEALPSFFSSYRFVVPRQILTAHNPFLIPIKEVIQIIGYRPDIVSAATDHG